MLHRVLNGGAPRIGVFTFVAAVCLANIVLFQKPLLDFAIPLSDLPSWKGYFQIASMQIIQFCVLGCALLLCALLSSFVLKLICSAMFLTNAAALYFMLSYGIEFDRAMIDSILNTDQREATELWHPKALFYLVAFGALPAALMFSAEIQMSRWYWRIGGAVALLAALTAWLFATSFIWLWLDLYASQMGRKVLPWSYLTATGRHYLRTALDTRVQSALPDAVFISENSSGKDVVVLVIGEAVRAENFAYYGYKRDTNPFTSAKGVQALPAGRSCSTHTRGSAACILTHEGRNANAWTGHEPLPSYLTRHGVETIFRSNNTGVPPLMVDRRETAREIADNCKETNCPTGKLDDSLNWGLAELLRKSEARRIFALIHQTGSHGPAYWTKYPAEFEHFTPVCETVQLVDCTREQLFNAYDNTLRYTDSLLADLIDQLESLEDTNAVLIYVPDHGQSLGENGFFTHGSPQVIAPDEQRIIPFLVWMSDGFRESRGIGEAGLAIDQGFPHDFPFHSVMGAFGMRSEVYKPEFDIFDLGQRND